MLEVARAELEDLEARGVLDAGGWAALAEARWRGADLEAAAEAASRHLDAGGDDTMAIVVAAEAAAAAGQPAAAQAFVERVGALDPMTLDALFAGMPRRAYWPSAGHSGEATDAGASAAASVSGEPIASAAGRESTAGAASAEGGRLSSLPSPAEVLAANGELWEPAALADSIATAAPASPSAALTRAAAPAWVEPARPKGHADPEAELDVAHEELASAPHRGLLRLALVLRLDPTLAPEVLDALRLRREPEALVIRGDAQRLLGRHLEAEAAFAEAAEAIERDAIARARRAGPHAPTEDS
jgi:hypothetical protein